MLFFSEFFGWYTLILTFFEIHYPINNFVFFTIYRELLRDSNVRFAGYKHPHPLENDIVIKIQTASGNQPTQVLSNAARRLEFDFRSLLKDFQDSIKEMGQEAEQIGGS